MSHTFLLNTQYWSSKAHPYGSDNIFPLELLFFFLSESGSCSFREIEREREREGGETGRPGGFRKEM